MAIKVPHLTYHDILCRYLNVPRLITWLSSRQYAPEGGFSGRTNKLVDGCYSHWVGSCFPLIEACLSPATTGLASSSEPKTTTTAGTSSITHKLPPPPETLFSREGLIRYILCCCQDETKRGGLRDKPGKCVFLPSPYSLLVALFFSSACLFMLWIHSPQAEEQMLNTALLHHPPYAA